ncbi:MAG: hypothetical protein HY782_21020 [Chloroflexi bacterium]|nr:hypothetical protein [Chloroflexota bacterium]
MTRDKRLALFKRDLQALMPEEDAIVIFNLAHDEDAFAQFSHLGPGEPLLCEVSNRSEGLNAPRLNVQQVAQLRALGYAIPSPHHQANPHKEYPQGGDLGALAEETEQIFRSVFGAPEDYEVESSGVMW